LKYKMNFAFRVGFPNGPLGWKSVGICSEIRSSAEFKSRFAFVSAPFAPTRYRAQTHWYRSSTGAS
jgi:hypothetical protein